MELFIDIIEVLIYANGICEKAEGKFEIPRDRSSTSLHRQFEKCIILELLAPWYDPNPVCRPFLAELGLYTCI